MCNDRQTVARMDPCPGLARAGLAPLRNEGNRRCTAVVPLASDVSAAPPWPPSLTLTASLALASPASAQLSFQGFVTHGDAKAGWITETNTPVGATDQDSIELFVNGTGPTDLDDAARAILTGIRRGPAGHPAELRLQGVEHGRERRLGAAPDQVQRRRQRRAAAAHPAVRPVDSRGRCDERLGHRAAGAALASPSRATPQLLACHPGATVAGVELVNDSGWLHPGGFQVLVDNVSYGGETITAPPPPVQGESADAHERRRRRDRTAAREDRLRGRGQRPRQV